MVDWWAVALMTIGSFIMGFIVIWIAFFFFAREKEFTAAEFGGFITAFFGGAILTIFTTFTNAETQWIFWWYPVGLLIGMFAYKQSGGNITVMGLKEFRRHSITQTLLTSPSQILRPIHVTFNAEQKPKIGNFTPKSGDTCLVLDLTIQNYDINDFDYTDSSFAIYDNTTRNKLSPITSKVISELSNPLIPGKVPVKSTKTGQIAFEVSGVSTSFRFSVYYPNGDEIASFDEIAH